MKRTPWPLPVQVARDCRFSCSRSWPGDHAWFTRALAGFPGWPRGPAASAATVSNRAASPTSGSTFPRDPHAGNNTRIPRPPSA